MRNPVSNCALPLALGVLASLGAQSAAHAQGRGGAGAAPQTAQAAAPVDFTGYWTSIVTDEDWEYRMVTPRPGDYAGVPLKPAGMQIMNAWDPSRDTAAGEQCKSYGAPTIMRVPGHFHISWQDGQTLKIEVDTGQQTRLLHFVPPEGGQGQRSLQGYSMAQWQLQGRGGRPGVPARPAWGALKVTTSHLTAGYLRKNGIPYSEEAQLVEYFDLVQDGDDGNNGQWVMVLTSTVTDPVYLYQPFVTDENFLKLPNGASWAPSACSAMW